MGRGYFACLMGQLSIPLNHLEALKNTECPGESFIVGLGWCLDISIFRGT